MTKPIGYALNLQTTKKQIGIGVGWFDDSPQGGVSAWLLSND